MNSNRHSQPYRFSGFELDLGAGELQKQGRKIRLQGQPLDILVMLLERRGEVVTREELQRRLWPADTFVDFEHSLNAAVKRLREALDDSADAPQFIETLPRRGYRFIGMLDEGRQPASQRRRGLATLRQFAYAAIALCTLGGVLLGLNVGGWRDLMLHGSHVPRIQSIAVLPLENLSRDPQQEYFADGMTDALIAGLAQVRALRVISRTSILQYKRTQKPLSEIARELNVDAVVEGTVLRDGERVRITAQLVDARTDTHLWAQNYDRDLRDVLALQAGVTRSVTEEVRAQVTPQEHERLIRAQRAVNPQAYEAWLRGNSEWYKLTEQGLRKSADYYEEAIRLDPEYAPAHLGLASSYAVLGQQEILPPQEAYAKSRAEALKALELDDELAEAHTVMGWVHRNYDWDWPGAEREFLHGLELNPGSPLVHHGYSAYLEARGRLEEALAEQKRAQELDPLNPFYNVQLGLLLIALGRYDEALAQCRRAVEFDPSHVRAHFCVGEVYVGQRKYEQAVAEMHKAVELPKGRVDVVASLAQVYVLAGRKPEAEKLFNHVKALAKQRHISPLDIAYFYAILGQKDEAFQWLEKAYQERSPFIVTIRLNPTFDGLRDDPRYISLLRRIGLPN